MLPTRALKGTHHAFKSVLFTCKSYTCGLYKVELRCFGHRSHNREQKIMTQKECKYICAAAGQKAFKLPALRDTHSNNREAEDGACSLASHRLLWLFFQYNIMFNFIRKLTGFTEERVFPTLPDGSGNCLSCCYSSEWTLMMKTERGRANFQGESIDSRQQQQQCLK